MRFNQIFIGILLTGFITGFIMGFMDEFYKQFAIAYILILVCIGLVYACIGDLKWENTK
jgi:hypothetical protein